MNGNLIGGLAQGFTQGYNLAQTMKDNNRREKLRKGLGEIYDPEPTETDKQLANRPNVKGDVSQGDQLMNRLRQEKALYAKYGTPDQIAQAEQRMADINRYRQEQERWNKTFGLRQDRFDLSREQAELGMRVTQAELDEMARQRELAAAGREYFQENYADTDPRELAVGLSAATGNYGQAAQFANQNYYRNSQEDRAQEQADLRVRESNLRIEALADEQERARNVQNILNNKTPEDYGGDAEYLDALVRASGNTEMLAEMMGDDLEQTRQRAINDISMSSPEDLTARYNSNVPDGYQARIAQGDDGRRVFQVFSESNPSVVEDEFSFGNQTEFLTEITPRMGSLDDRTANGLYDVIRERLKAQQDNADGGINIGSLDPEWLRAEISNTSKALMRNDGVDPQTASPDMVRQYQVTGENLVINQLRRTHQGLTNGSFGQGASRKTIDIGAVEQEAERTLGGSGRSSPATGRSGVMFDYNIQPSGPPTGMTLMGGQSQGLGQ